MFSAGVEPGILARKVGVDQKSVERWITRGVVPHARHRFLTSRVLGCSESELWPPKLPRSTRATAVTTSEGTRYCGRCGTRLAGDNRGATCGPCGRKQADALIASRPPQVAPEFWHTDLIRDSLAGRHLGHFLRAFREHPFHGPRGIPQEVMARWLHLSQAQLSRVENGPAVNDLQRLTEWARLFQIPRALLWFDIDPDQSPEAERRAVSQSKAYEPVPDMLRSSFATDMSDMVEAVKRREFLLGMTATVGFGATGIAPTFKHVDPELIPYFQQQLEGHYRADMLLGPRALISTVTAQGKLIGQLIDSADEPTRQRMAVVGTSFASFAAWLYLDAGDMAAALHWHDVAQEMAHRSRNREAVACALVDRAMARTDQGMGSAVMDLCDSALMDAGHLSPEIHVFALQQKAHGASIIGDRRQVDALLDTAGRFVGQVDVEVWGVPCLRTPNYVEVHRATCYGRLGLAKEALGIWNQIIPAAPSTARRDVGVWVARQAALVASLQDPEWTVELAQQAVKIALETGSARVYRELAAARVTMAPWQAEPVGQDFAEVLAPISEGISS